ncbi:unnamed protein product [Diamesa serratosioi]
MGWTGFRCILATIMIITGTFNSLFSELFGKIYSKGQDGVRRPFGFPFLQVGFLFVGEMLCLLVFKLMFLYVKNKNLSEDVHILVKGNRAFNPLILWLPGVLHAISATLLVVGLNFTSVASCQVLRGSAIVFVVFMSVFFLKQRPYIREWIGIFVIICGLAVVGFSDLSENTFKVDKYIIGDILVLLGHFMKACQMVYEEHFVTKYDIPSLQAIGWEGIFGVMIIIILLFPFYYIKVPPPFNGNARQVLEDAPDGFTLIINNLLLMVPLFGSIISIAFYNYAGLSMTKEISSTTRMVFEIVCIITVWSFSLMIGWQKFDILQLLGFIVMLIGLTIYSEFTLTIRIFTLLTTRSSYFTPLTAF